MSALLVLAAKLCLAGMGVLALGCAGMLVAAYVLEALRERRERGRA